MKHPKYALLALILAATPALAAEYHIGDTALKNGMNIQPNYLTGIEMDRMPEKMDMGADAVHLEADVHAAKGETHGFHEGEWIPDLTISYTIEKVGGKFKKTGHLFAMTAGDGPHYANNVALDGKGQYHLTYTFEPPSKKGFIRHIDKATGVPDWWTPFSMDWTFDYPAK